MVLPEAPNPSRANRPPPRAMELPICESGKGGFTAPAGKQAAGEAAVLEPSRTCLRCLGEGVTVRLESEMP